MHQPVNEGVELLDIPLRDAEAEALTPSRIKAARKSLNFQAYRILEKGEHGRAEAGMTTVAGDGCLVVGSRGSYIELEKGALGLLEPFAKAVVEGGAVVIACAWSIVYAKDDSLVYAHPAAIVCAEAGARVVHNI